jgi:hypothetical protein
VPSSFLSLRKYGAISLDHNKSVGSHDGVMLYALALSALDEAAQEQAKGKGHLVPVSTDERGKDTGSQCRVMRGFELWGWCV